MSVPEIEPIEPIDIEPREAEISRRGASVDFLFERKLSAEEVKADEEAQEVLNSYVFTNATLLYAINEIERRCGKKYPIWIKTSDQERSFCNPREKRKAYVFNFRPMASFLTIDEVEALLRDYPFIVGDENSFYINGTLLSIHFHTLTDLEKKSWIEQSRKLLGSFQPKNAVVHAVLNEVCKEVPRLLFNWYNCTLDSFTLKDLFLEHNICTKDLVVLSTLEVLNDAQVLYKLPQAMTLSDSEFNRGTALLNAFNRYRQIGLEFIGEIPARVVQGLSSIADSVAESAAEGIVGKKLNLFD